MGGISGTIIKDGTLPRVAVDSTFSALLTNLGFQDPQVLVVCGQ